MASGRCWFVACLSLAILGLALGCGQSGASKNAEPGAEKTGGLAGTSPPLPPKSDSDPLHPVVELTTSLGKITLRLDAEKAPQTVDNFLIYVNGRQYDNTLVHQVYKGQGIVAGGFGPNFVEKKHRTPIRSEADNGLKNRRATISMVRQPDVIDSATCQFFINVSDNPELDYRNRTPQGYGYCVFGEITDGMEVVEKIASLPVQDTPQLDRTPAQPILIETAKRIR